MDKILSTMRANKEILLYISNIQTIVITAVLVLHASIVRDHHPTVADASAAVGATIAAATATAAAIAATVTAIAPTAAAATPPSPPPSLPPPQPSFLPPLLHAAFWLIVGCFLHHCLPLPLLLLFADALTL